MLIVDFYRYRPVSLSVVLGILALSVIVHAGQKSADPGAA